MFFWFKCLPSHYRITYNMYIYIYIWVALYVCNLFYLAFFSTQQQFACSIRLLLQTTSICFYLVKLRLGSYYLFYILFIYSETNQSQVLEKHVKMVENKKNITEVNGKKVIFQFYLLLCHVAPLYITMSQVCWMYRQGRCRFGRKCKMFHDSDLRDNFLRSMVKFVRNTSYAVLISF